MRLETNNMVEPVIQIQTVDRSSLCVHLREIRKIVAVPYEGSYYYVSLFMPYVDDVSQETHKLLLDEGEKNRLEAAWLAVHNERVANQRAKIMNKLRRKKPSPYYAWDRTDQSGTYFQTLLNLRHIEMIDFEAYESRTDGLTRATLALEDGRSKICQCQETDRLALAKAWQAWIDPQARQANSDG